MSPESPVPQPFHWCYFQETRNTIRHECYGINIRNISGAKYAGIGGRWRLATRRNRRPAAQAAEELFDDATKELLVLPEGFLENNDIEMIQPVSAEAEEAHMQVWTEFKSACGQ